MKRLRFLLTAFLSALLTVTAVAACNAGGGGGGTTAGNATLIMATSADYPPYEYVDSSSGSQEIVGFDIDIAKYITGELGRELRIDNIDFNGLIPALQSKRADFVMAGMTPTEERKQNVDFSSIYFEAKNTIVAKAGSNLTSAASLNGKTVAVQLGSIQEQAAKEMQGAEVKSLNRISEMIQELKSGRVEALIVEDTVAKGYVESNPDLELNVIPNEGASGSAIAFPKGSELVAQFNPILEEMKTNGTMDELIAKWFGENSPAPTSES
ncbi:MAG: transporter substrate-binding domain-containing protein [Cyanobacteria bacterium RM1_2_2]|nr:transporter substrate-binding domain-containing protein [Cyanobacteria bacterium RM1_2_2]